MTDQQWYFLPIKNAHQKLLGFVRKCLFGIVPAIECTSQFAVIHVAPYNNEAQKLKCGPITHLLWKHGRKPGVFIEIAEEALYIHFYTSDYNNFKHIDSILVCVIDETGTLINNPTLLPAVLSVSDSVLR